MGLHGELKRNIPLAFLNHRDFLTQQRARQMTGPRCLWREADNSRGTFWAVHLYYLIVSLDSIPATSSLALS